MDNNNNNINFTNVKNIQQSQNERVFFYEEDEIIEPVRNKKMRKEDYINQLNETIEEVRKKFLNISSKSLEIINSKSFYYISPFDISPNNEPDNNKPTENKPEEKYDKEENIYNISPKSDFSNLSLNKENSKDSILLGKKRKNDISGDLNNEGDEENEKIEEEKNDIYKEISDKINEVSNIDSNIIRIEKPLNIIKGIKHVKINIKDEISVIIYWEKDSIYKIYFSKMDKSYVKNKEIISQLKKIKQQIFSIYNQIIKDTS